MRAADILLTPGGRGDIPLKIISGCFSQWKQLLLHRNSPPAAQEFAAGIVQAANGCYFRQGTCGKNSVSLYWNSDELAATSLSHYRNSFLRHKRMRPEQLDPLLDSFSRKGNYYIFDGSFLKG
jgi:hypothetical protein